MPDSGTPPTPDPAVARDKAQGYLDKLFDALQEFEEGGGVTEAARLGGWRPSRLEEAADALGATRDAIDGELARLGAARRAGARP